jgi:hypothetical protein
MASKRAGKTVKVSVSLDAQDVTALRKLAKEAYGGNLSAAFGEAARWIRQREARRRLVEALGGSTLTDEVRAAIDAEQGATSRRGSKRSARKKAA